MKENQTIRLRHAERWDLDKIYACEKACFPEDPWSLMMLYEEICENPASIYLVLVHKKKIVGYCGCYIVLDEAHITNICVLPEYRQRGLATRMMHALQEESEKRGAVAMTLEVAVSNKAALKLYKNFGFSVQGVRKKYYRGKEDAYIMWTQPREEKATIAGEVSGLS